MPDPNPLRFHDLGRFAGDPRTLPEVLDDAGWDDPTRRPADDSIPDELLDRVHALIRSLLAKAKPYRLLVSQFGERRLYDEGETLERELHDELVRRREARRAGRVA